MFKKNYPHYLHKTGENGCYVYVERPGRAHADLVSESGLSVDEFAKHYVYQTEATWRLIEPRDNATLISIFDVDGGTMNHLTGEPLKLFMKCADVMQSHYPERSAKVYIINVPWWFQAGWAIVSPFVDPRTKKKVSICGRDYKKELLKSIPAENLPVEFGGSDQCPFGLSPAERKIWKHVTEVNAKHGIETEDIEVVYAAQRANLFKRKRDKSTQQSTNDKSSNGETNNCESTTEIPSNSPTPRDDQPVTSDLVDFDLSPPPAASVLTNPS